MDPQMIATVLVVEDHEPTSVLTTKFLNSEGIRTVTVANGAEAIEYLREHRPTAVLTDLIMPFVDGLTLTRTIKQCPRTADIPVVMCTAVTGPETDQAARVAGVQAMVSKPFRKRELVDAVSQALASAVVEQPVAA